MKKFYMKNMTLQYLHKQVNFNKKWEMIELWIDVNVIK